ncbi:orotidine-5'-phosphate decarboxylase [Arenivirga flava]|uniref:Orotidine-5'-phosphate decarboxylase n=1 Tax=Arenivirga flava TaxID=1930060 RepID=A0AA37UE95_9MICO|nr:orotidine-5'-phosphate decarboxylase [Arenivirga flava]GMA27593.1 orotidine 5'-phosphate decarboxylase [Arenivirga flava]
MSTEVTPVSFGARLARATGAHGTVCVGIDPHAWLLERWELPDTAEGLRRFGFGVVSAAAGRAAVVKPQVAFFERHGALGLAALEEVIAAARAEGLLVIADAKRGDVGSTVEAYGEAWLRDGSPLRSDALTVVAYQGVGSLAGPMDLAQRTGAGLFVLAATSNPESAVPQRALRADGRTVAAGVAAEVVAENAARFADEPLGSFGLVLGATVDLAAIGIDTASFGGAPILAPGFGHQGARLQDLRRLYGAASGQVLVSSSRELLSAGPDGLADAIARQTEEVAACLA